MISDNVGDTTTPPTLAIQIYLLWYKPTLDSCKQIAMLNDVERNFFLSFLATQNHLNCYDTYLALISTWQQTSASKFLNLDCHARQISILIYFTVSHNTCRILPSRGCSQQINTDNMKLKRGLYIAEGI